MAKKPLKLENGVAWTDEMKEQVLGWRPGPCPELAPLDEVLEERRERVQNKAQGGRINLVPKIIEGRAQTAAHLLPLTDAVLAMIESGDPVPKGSLDVGTEAALVALELYRPYCAIEFWLHREGPLFALRALVKSHEFCSSARTISSYGKPIYLRDGWEDAGNSPEYAENAWLKLRQAVNAADEATYAELRQEADALRAKAPVAVQAWIAFAFTAERAWADEAAKQVVAAFREASGWCRCLVAVASIEWGVKLAQNKQWVLGEEHLLTLLAREGGAAAPVLLAALDTASNNDDRKTYATLLSRVETEEAARGLARYLGHKGVAPIAQKYFKRVPELARRVLEPLAEGKGAQAVAAKVVLASLG